MTRLALALLATLTTGCILEADSETGEKGFINAAWRFRTANGAGAGCLEGFPSTLVTAQPVADGPAILEPYACETLAGSFGCPLGEYDVTIAITDGSGQPHASSLAKRVDIVITDALVGEEFIVDGGRVLFSWALVDAGTSGALDCAAAGSSEISLELVSGDAIFTTELACSDGAGLSNPVPAGTYGATVSALDLAGEPVGTPHTRTIEIGQPNDYADAGVISLSID